MVICVERDTDSLQRTIRARETRHTQVVCMLHTCELETILLLCLARMPTHAIISFIFNVYDMDVRSRINMDVVTYET